MARFELFRKADIERDAMIKELVKSYQTLCLQYEQKCHDYDDAVESRRTWQAKAMQMSREVNELQRVNVSTQSLLHVEPLISDTRARTLISLSSSLSMETEHTSVTSLSQEEMKVAKKPRRDC